MTFIEKIREKWYRDGKAKLAAALLLNAFFLLIVLSCFTPRFETNDEVLMSKFVDGQMAEKSAYIPFINIVLGFFLKLEYSLLGESLNWYSISQYALMFCAFSAITWVLLRRFRLLPALSMAAIVLMTVGMNAYLYPSFSKVCALGTAGGLSLMLYAKGGERLEKLPIALGFVLALLGYLWRYEEFFGVAALMAPVGLTAMLGIWKSSRGEAIGQKFKKIWTYARPFLLLLAAVLVLYGFDRFMWTRGDYKQFTEFNYTRHVLMDYAELPDYDEMREVYDSLDIDDNAVYFLKNWNFYDTEKFSLEQMEAVLAARDLWTEHKGLGECLGVFLDEAIPGLTKTLAFYAPALMLMLWLSCGCRSWRHWMGLLLSLGFFGIIYMLMIYQNRYLANRMDMGLLLALALAMSFFMDEKKLRGDRLLCCTLAAAAVFIGLYMNKNVCLYSGQYAVEDKSSQKAAVELLLEDEEHLYLCKVWSIDHELYGPLETAPAGYADKIVLLGGWSLYHPSIEHVLESYGIENPYPDMIDNPRVLLIDKDIERTVEYLQKYYEPSARAEKLEELSAETGLEIYRMVSEE